jgi:RNAse (barnase) inhibitor barstar
MTSYVDMRKEFPGLRGLYIHAVDIKIEPLEAALSARDFKVYMIDGSKISDKKTFFNETAQTFDFPDYFSYGWDGFDDCFSEVELGPERKFAIVWQDADQTLSADVQTFLEAVCTFYNFAIGLRTCDKAEGESIQLEVFLVGHGNWTLAIFKRRIG